MCFLLLCWKWFFCGENFQYMIARNAEVQALFQLWQKQKMLSQGQFRFNDGDNMSETLTPKNKFHKTKRNEL